ncbi:MAG TPA: 30S ribosome-binding factor RbfA [Chthoniobacteraceae bacterium]|jgi:ribosome-binding factor A|nr:30S ribosome-binding factor RbfA [Chthoniobacteraceae bacterium]
MKHRLQRVNELIKRELGELIIRECRFTAQLVTVQQVDVSPDLKHAHVYISVIGTEEERNQAMATLHAERPQFQQALAKRVVLKFTPHLHFKIDEAAERGDRVLNILSELESTGEVPDEKPSPNES